MCSNHSFIKQFNELFSDDEVLLNVAAFRKICKLLVNKWQCESNSRPAYWLICANTDPITILKGRLCICVPNI